MAIEYVAAVLRGAFGLDPTAKLILLIVAEYARASSGGVAWPSVATIARLACISQRRTQIHLRRLRDGGWLTVVRAGAGGSGCTIHYRINVQRLQAAMKNGDGNITVPSPQNHDGNITVSDAATVTGMSANGDGHATKTLTQTSPEPVLAVINKPGVEPLAVSLNGKQPTSNPVNKEQINLKPQEAPADAGTDGMTPLQRQIQPLIDRMKARRR